MAGRESTAPRDQLGELSGAVDPMHRLALGHALFRLVSPADSYHYMEGPEEPVPARVVYRVVPLTLFRTEYAFDRRSTGSLVSRHRRPLARRCLPLARCGTANLAGAIVKAGAGRRRLFRAHLLLSPIHHRLLYPRSPIVSRRGPYAAAGCSRDARRAARSSVVDHETGWEKHAVWR